MVVRQSGANVLDPADPGRGFYLVSFNGSHGVIQPLKNVRVTGDLLQVSSSKGLPRFTFKLTQGSRFLALILVRVEGLPRRSLASLNLNINARPTLRALSLDYMTTMVKRGGAITIHWPYLWHRNPSDPLGAAALYNAYSPGDSDAALAQIWADTDLPHPDIGQPWTPARVKKWVAAYAEKFRDQSTMYIAPHNESELYKLTKFAHKHGVKTVYLFSNVWSDGFWDNSFSQVAVNRKVFPRGRVDLIRYAAWLHRHGMLLALHYVSGGIGPFDRSLMADKSVLYNLAAWAHGTLAAAADARSTTLYFRPKPGGEYPLRVRYPAGPNELSDFFSTHVVRIGGELVKVGHFEDLDKPVWKFADCRRGYGATTAKAHNAGVSCAGLDLAYGQVFSPDADSPLMSAMAQQWAQFVNHVGVDHFSYDGYEDQFTVPWGGIKYSNLVASFLNRAVTTNTSGEVPVSANLEMKFSHIKSIHQFGYDSVNLSIKLAGNSPASSLLGASFEIPAGFSTGARRFMILKPEPMFGISMHTLEHFGLRDRMLRLFSMWKHALPHLTTVQLAAIAHTLAPASRYNVLNQGGNHLSGRDCFVITRSGRSYRITPTRVMVRKTGDVRWLVGQEFGPVGPYQYIQPGDSLSLNNPYQQQPAGFIIRVLPAMGPGQALSIEPKAAAIQYHVRKNVAPPVKGVLMPEFTQDGAAIVVAARNPFATAQVLCHNLPYWSQAFSMAHGRGIFMRVTGDGGGEVLLLQIHGGGVRDYAVKINFTGTKTIVIPNGEVSWADGFWGWRMGSKNIDYAHISSLSIGFGYLPPRCRARVRVSRLMVLKNQPAELVNPVISTGAGCLEVNGNVSSGDILTYTSGSTVNIYDRNWNKIKYLPVTLHNYTMPHGYATVKVLDAGGKPQPWLRCRFITRGKALIVPAN